jgi:hypothetical protein
LQNSWILVSEITEDLGGSLIGDVRTGGVGGAGIFRDPVRLDAGAGEKRRSSQTSRPGSNREHAGLEHFHGFPLLMRPPGSKPERALNQRALSFTNGKCSVAICLALLYFTIVKFGKREAIVCRFGKTAGRNR